MGLEFTNDYSSFSSISDQFGSATVTPELPEANPVNFGTTSQVAVATNPKSDSFSFSGVLGGIGAGARDLAGTIGGIANTALDIRSKQLQAEIQSNTLQVQKANAGAQKDIALAQISGTRSAEIAKAEAAAAIASAQAAASRNTPVQNKKDNSTLYIVGALLAVVFLMRGKSAS